MLPADWVTAAVEALAAGRAPRAPTAPAEDDDSWTALSPAELFGDFPRSGLLSQWATAEAARVPEAARPRIRFARRSLRQLAEHVRALLGAAGDGPEAVARAGAEIISAGDRRYFGEELRRKRIIPLFAENPLRTRPIDTRGAPTQAAVLVRTALLRRRLQDGDAAVGHYDLSRPVDLRRAVDVAREALAPEAGAGGALWLFVSGSSRDDPWAPESALPYLEELRDAARGAGADVTRLRFLTRAAHAREDEASTDPGWIDSLLHRYADPELFVAVELRAGELEARVGAERP